MRQSVALCASALCALGCGNTGIERQFPNHPPDTRLTSGPPDSIGGTSYRVELAWLGSDVDDGVDHYEFILVDHPAAYDSLNDVTRTFAIPRADDPRWTRTTSTDSIFVVSADTLHRDRRPGPGETPEDVLRTFFKRWHTFFVRAVDHHGAADPTPDYRTFNARTLAPTVAMRAPVEAGRFLLASSDILLSWEGLDPLDKVTTDRPDSSRWVFVRTNYFIPGFTPDSLYALQADRWSPWRAWDAADASGTSVWLHQLRPAGRPPNGWYLFAVQAKDRAGAVTPVFDSETAGKNNVAVLRVEWERAPLLYLEEPNLGPHVLVGEARPVQLDIVAGQELRFRWRGDASAYGGTMQAYRYGWDLGDPSDADGWECGWSSECVQTRRRFSGPGIHRFYVQGRDTEGNEVHVELEYVVHALTRRRDLLLVDDALHARLADDPEENLEDRRWLTLQR